MAYKEIELLIEKYFAGESSLQEEARLKAYFNGTEIHSSLNQYTPLFQNYQSESDIKLSKTFDEKLFKNLETIEIEDLLEKYFKAETKLEEEEQLKAYFKQNHIANSLNKYQGLFQYFEAESSLQLSGSFDEKLLGKLKQTESTKFRTRRLYPTLMRIAAVLVFAIGVFFMFDKGGDELSGYKKEMATTEVEEMTPEEAYNEVMAALALVSSKLNKGESKALEGLSKIDKASKALR